MQYWYNVDSGQVETDETKSAGAQVMGPYASQDEAANALRTAHERSQRWDDEDREWNARGAAPREGTEDLED